MEVEVQSQVPVTPCTHRKQACLVCIADGTAAVPSAASFAPQVGVEQTAGMANHTSCNSRTSRYQLNLRCYLLGGGTGYPRVGGGSWRGCGGCGCDGGVGLDGGDGGCGGDGLASVSPHY